MKNYMIVISSIFTTFYITKKIYDSYFNIPPTIDHVNDNDIKQFDLNCTNIGDNLFIIGNRESGKTTLISKIIDYNNEIQVELIISPTECLEKMYSSHNNKHSYYESSIIYDFIHTQKNNINDNTIRCNECIIVLDNCFLNSSYNDSNLTDLLINGYYYKTINIISAAYPIEFSKYFKSSIDYLFVFKNTHIIYKKLIYEEYFVDIIKDYNQYLTLLDKYTTNYGCLIVDFKNNGKLFFL